MILKGEMIPDVEKPTVIHHFQEAEMVLNLVGLFEICGRRMEGLKGFHIPFFLLTSYPQFFWAVGTQFEFCFNGSGGNWFPRTSAR